jgi:oligopeptide/dipeptide ABC transporter ATP-binding protein
VRSVCDDVMVLYAGHRVESGSRQALRTAPLHPYSDLLISSIPELRQGWLDGLPAKDRQPETGVALQPLQPQGCPFVARCPVRLPARLTPEQVYGHNLRERPDVDARQQPSGLVTDPHEEREDPAVQVVQEVLPPAEQLCELPRNRAPLVALRRNRGERAVELLRAAGARERLERMEGQDGAPGGSSTGARSWWTARRSDEGWRSYVHPSGDTENPTLRHLDHVHIDVV